MIEEQIEKVEEGPVILGGDFDAKTGREKGRLGEEEIQRRNRDKVINKEGEELLSKIREKGLHIINGDTEEDSQGDFTYIGGEGRSAIDYVITGEEGRDWIKDICIGRRKDSAHLPIELELKKARGGNRETEMGHGLVRRRNS